MRSYFENSHILQHHTNDSRRSAINFSTNFVMKKKKKERKKESNLVHYNNNTILDYE